MNPRLAVIALVALFLHPHLSGPSHGLSLTIPPSFIAAAAVTIAALVLAWLATRPMMRLACRRVSLGA